MQDPQPAASVESTDTEAAPLSLRTGGAAWRLRRDGLRLLPMMGSVALVGIVMATLIQADLQQAAAAMGVQALFAAALYAYLDAAYARKAQRTLARLHQQVSKRVETPDAGSAFSATSFRRRLQQECHRSQRYGLHLTLLAVQCHSETGSADARATQSVAATVLSSVAAGMRKEDVVGHIEALSFGVYLPHTTREGAGAVARWLATQLNQLAPSIGMAAFGENGEDAETLISAALADATTSSSPTRSAVAWNERDIA